jgi:hypothetical protein
VIIFQEVLKEDNIKREAIIYWQTYYNSNFIFILYK